MIFFGLGAWKGNTSVDITIISLDIPCFLSSVFDDNEDEYVVSYFSFSNHFVDVSPYELEQFPLKELSLNKSNDSSFSKYVLDVEYFMFVVFDFLEISLFSFFLCCEAIYFLMSFISILFVINNGGCSHLFRLNCASSHVLRTFFVAKCFWFYFLLACIWACYYFFRSLSSLSKINLISFDILCRSSLVKSFIKRLYFKWLIISFIDSFCP